MRQLRKTLAVLVFGVVLASLSQFPASAGEPPRLESSVARVNVGPTSVDWSPAIDYERLVLTVAGPGGLVSRQELEAGQTPSLSLFDKNGERLPDGIYRYELRILPRGGEMKNPLQGGALWVQGGKFVAPNPAENPASLPSKSRHITQKDSVVSDDLVVQGTACIGPSCLNGDPDSNTLTLEGSNPRIFFHDPLADCVCYPARNWLLQANDPGVGDNFSLKDLLSGLNPFSVLGGTPNNALVVTGGGFDHQESRVGIGTLVPLKNLHVLNAATPTIRLEQPVSPGPARSWDVGASDTQFFISDVTNSSSQPFRVRAGAPTSSIDVAANGNVGIGTSAPAVRLDAKTNSNAAAVGRVQNTSTTGYSGFEYLDNAGNVALYFGTDNASANTRFNSVNNFPIVILTNSTERLRVTSAGNVGIGTATPGARLEVSGGEVRLPPGAGAAGFTHFNYVGDGKNYIRGTTIIADNAGSVGIGTAAPSSKLHVFGNNGTTKGLIEEASATTAAREILEIRNNGGTVMILEDTAVSQRWAIGTQGANLAIDEQAHAGTEYTFSNTGNLTISGTLTQGSSRDLKTNFASLDPKDVLSRVTALPVSLWSYKTETGVRHVGPMAEDFTAAFGLGEDSKHVAPLDVAGVSLVAIQALNGKVTEIVTAKDAEIAQLRRENTQLAERLAALEAAVSAMANK